LIKPFILTFFLIIKKVKDVNEPERIVKKFCIDTNLSGGTALLLVYHICYQALVPKFGKLRVP
jgi:hypothetical protein